MKIAGGDVKAGWVAEYGDAGGRDRLKPVLLLAGLLGPAPHAGKAWRAGFFRPEAGKRSEARMARSAKKKDA